MNSIRRFLTYITFSIFLSNAYAQKFTLTDGNKFEVFYAGQQHITGQLRFQNMTDDHLLLSWETVEYNIPGNQTYNVCDNIHCFLEIPPIGQVIQMDTIRKNDYGFLKPELRNWNCQDKITTRMVFDVYPTGMKSEAQRVTFLFHCFPTGSTEFISEKINISPNPFRDEITINTSNGNVLNVQLLNTLGEVILTTNEKQLQTADLPTGVYLLKVDFTNANPLIYKVIKH